MSNIADKISIEMAYQIEMPWVYGVSRAGELKELKSQANSEKSQLEAFSEDLSSSIQEQNEYILEIEDMQLELESLKNTYTKQMENTESKYIELKEKALTGDITEEEQKELDSLEAERNGFVSEYSSKSQEVSNSINVSRQSYTDASDKTNSLTSIVNETNTTIEGLNEWNENNSVENGGGRVCERYIKTNEKVINDLNEKINTAQDQSEKYNKQYSFLKS